LKLDSKIENIRDCYKIINDFKKGYYPKPNIVKDEKGDLVNTPTVFCLGGGTISLSY
jgi:hypothetical protein